LVGKWGEERLRGGDLGGGGGGGVESWGV